MNKKLPKILIIAGSDSGGGAGLQTDIKVATAHKVYAAAVATCLTAQNTVGVASVYNPPLQFLKAQLDAVLDDISFDAIKIGMLGRADIVACVADVLAKKAPKTPIILDPVMVATSGDVLLATNAVKALKKFCGQSFLVTPNIDEAVILAEMEIKNVADMKKAALKIKALGVKNVLVKGGHLKAVKGEIVNILLDEKGDFHEISCKKVKGEVHGTGCALASSVACDIACKKDLLNSVKNANIYIYKSLLKAQKIGSGAKILQHF